MIFKSHCRNYVMPTYAGNATHEEHYEHCTDAQNSNHACVRCMKNAG